MNERMFDIGKVMDEVFNAAHTFSEQFREGWHHGRPGHAPWWFWNENIDFYPAFNYPPANVYMTSDKHLVFEFALAGFEEKDIDLKFRGDYLILSARIPLEMSEREGVRYFKRRLKFKDIESQRYYAPADKFNHEGVTASFKKGVLTVDLPPVEGSPNDEGVHIDIQGEDE